MALACKTEFANRDPFLPLRLSTFDKGFLAYLAVIIVPGFKCRLSNNFVETSSVRLSNSCRDDFALNFKKHNTYQRPYLSL